MSNVGRSVSYRRRLRVVAAALLTATTGVLAVRVFDRPAAGLMALAVVPPAIIGLVDTFSASGRRLLQGLSVLLAAAVATLIAGGRVPERTIEGLWRGWRLAISTDWPSPLRSELAAFVTALIGVAGSAAVELARSRRSRAVTLLPPACLGVILTTLAAPAGRPAGFVVGGWLVLAGAVLATGDASWPRPSLREELRVERRAVASLVALAVVSAGCVTVLGASATRHDPRADGANPVVTSDELNPLAQVAADRELVEPDPRFSVEGPMPSRWRTRVLDRYDGVSWSSDITVRPISRERITRRREGVAVTRQVITVVGADLAWLPISGVPVATDVAVESDTDRSMLAPERALVAGEQVTIESVPGPDRSRLSEGSTSRRELDGEAAPFAALAQELAGTAVSLSGRIEALEDAMRTRYRLAGNGAAGSNVGLLRYVLENSGEGTPEQFVAAFVLMARSLGASARIAVGYDVPPDGTTVTSATSVAWPEVFFEDVGWVAYDPVPERVDDAGDRGQDPLQAAQDAAAPPPAAVAPLPPEATPPESPEGGSSSRSMLAVVVLTLVVALAWILLAFGVAAGILMVLKGRRRRRRLRATAPDRLVLGAWAEATDHLVDLGAELAPHHTNGEMVLIGSGLLTARARQPLTDLAVLANAAAHGKDQPDRIVAAHAVRLLGQVEQVIGETRTRRARLRHRLSLRSVRRRTRSPAS